MRSLPARKCHHHLLQVERSADRDRIGVFHVPPESGAFCLLDEVESPWTFEHGTLCRMVKRMSDQTQFLFISHNKIAMEMAHQLIGVTMQEQGVSRIVAVDMESAANFATEAQAA